MTEYSESSIQNIINSEKNESVEFFDNFKIVKLTNSAYIYNNQIRNSSHDIYINSVSVEAINHTKDTTYIPQCNGNYTKLKSMYDDIHNAIRNDMYISSPLYSNSYYSNYNNLVNTRFSKVIRMNKKMFFCNHTLNAFGHTIFYFYPIVYIYYILRKYIPELILIITYESEYTRFLLETLQINDYVVINDHEQIINDDDTYFADQLTTNISKNIMNNYYYNIIVKCTLAVPLDCRNFPKKIVFIRNPHNIVSPGYIYNRQDIINIAGSYGYVDIDQTRLSLREVIHMLNNATHLILETGGSMTHLLWTKNIKSIILNYRPIYFDTLASLFPEADKILSLTSNNSFCDLAICKKSKIIINDYNYIKTGIASNDCYHFKKIDELKNAIEQNE